MTADYDFHEALLIRLRQPSGIAMLGVMAYDASALFDMGIDYEEGLKLSILRVCGRGRDGLPMYGFSDEALERFAALA